MVPSCSALQLCLLILSSLHQSDAFQLLPLSDKHVGYKPSSKSIPDFAKEEGNHHRRLSILMSNSKMDGSPDSPRSMRKFVSKKILSFPRLIASIARKPLVIGVAVLSASLAFRTTPAQASAPVMAIPKAEGRDPASEALMEMERRQMKKAQKELDEMTRQAREVERTQGEKARIKYEHEFKEKQKEEAAAKQRGLEDLKRNLLEQGIDPFTDLEGQRQIILYERGVDLGEVQGTQFHLEKEWERKNPKKSMAYKKAPNRRIIALMVKDMKNRGIDPLEYFEKRQDQTESIMNLPAARALALVEQYESNLEQYGQITKPKEGEMSAKERMAIEAEKVKNDPETIKAAKKEAKRKEAEEKARLKEEKRQLKAQAKVAKEKAREEAKKTKEEAKRSAAAAAATAAMTGDMAADQVESGFDSSEDDVVGTTDQLSSDYTDDLDEEKSIETTQNSQPIGSESSALQQHLPKVVGGVVVAGGGWYAFNTIREKRARDEEERQRQFRLLMGEADDDDEERSSAESSASSLEDFDTDIPPKKAAKETPKVEKNDAKENEKPLEEASSEPKKRRLGGLKGVFSKKKNAREVDLNKLLAEDAPAPELSGLLAKLLTFGAPGRFPNVESLPGGMPMEVFDLDLAKELLVQEREASGISPEDSAEVFANVVNCMLIDIVDLASSSLKEKDEAIMAKSINIVVDFMNHAASLYDSVAGDVSITPVTYGGTLSRSKLEQMYSVYAISGMTDLENVSDDFDSRVALLQDVFQISEKKAEGLMMKAVQKNMMKMLKDGKGMEGMEDMMKGMGGMEGLMGGSDGEGPSPEQLKEMLLTLKQMKDSGSIPTEELEAVKSQFKEAFGSGIDEVMKDAGSEGELSSNDKELLELMKSILDD